MVLVSATGGLDSTSRAEVLAKQTKDESYFLGAVYAGESTVLFTTQYADRRH
jgi:hypothetical protein